MKGMSIALCLFFLIWLPSTKANNVTSCLSNDDCSFHAECSDGDCLCNADCSPLGLLVLCGSDGIYYLNYCFLLTASCERQVDIQIHHIGYSEHCATHQLHPLITSMRTSLPSLTPCHPQGTLCSNYGVCVQHEGNVQYCSCPPRFGGDRCQNKVDTDTQTYVARGRPQAMVGDDVNSERHCDVIILTLFLSIVAAMISSVVTAAICYRCKNKKPRKRTKNFKESTNEPIIELQPSSTNPAETSA